MTDRSEDFSKPASMDAPAVPSINPPRRIRSAPPGTASASAAPPPSEVSARARRVRLKPPGAERKKCQPTGNHPIGYGRPPKHSQFKPNNPGGPGRPKGSRSQNSILRKELEAKQVVRIDGKGVKLSKRELATKMFITKAFEKGESKQLMQVIQFAQSLFPEATDSTASAPDAAATARFDQQLLQDFLAGLGMGQPVAGDRDPLAGLGLGLPDPASGVSHEAWAGSEDTNPVGRAGIRQGGGR